VCASVREGTPIRKPHYSYVTLGLIFLAVFAALGLGRFGYSMVLPAMQSDMGLTNTQTGQLQSWNLLGYMLAVVGAGAMASRWGPRGVITVALLTVALSMWATGLCASFVGVAVGRFFTGVGGAGANVPAMGLVAAWFSRRRRGLAAGIGVTGSSLGLMVTGPLVPWILERYGAQAGWRVCWAVFGCLALVVALLCAACLRNRPAELGLQPIGFDAAADGAEAPGAPATSWRSVCASGYLWHLAAVYFAFGFSYIIYSTFFVRHLVRSLGMETGAAGALWLQIGLVSTLSGFVWGAVSDRWGRKFALVCIFALQGVSFLVLGLAQGTPGAYVSAALFALTAWSIPAIMAAIAGDIFGARQAPAALGVMTFVFGLGQAMGPYVGGRLADATQSFSTAFMLAGAVALTLGLGGTLLLRRR